MQSSFSAIAHTSRDHDVLGKFRPFHYQALFVGVSLLANGPNTIILMVQVKVFLSVKKDLLREFQWQTTDEFLTAFMTFMISTIMKIVIFIVIVSRGSVVA